MPNVTKLASNDEPEIRTRELFVFTRERHFIYLRRRAGKPKPWTTNPILQQWRFCNVYRELDTVTQWIAQHWREPHRADPDLWFAMAVARFVNWPDSLNAIGYPVPWRPERFVKVLEDRMRRREKVFTGAYMIHADRHFAGSKAAYLATEVLSPLWDDRECLRSIVHGTSVPCPAAPMCYPNVPSLSPSACQTA
jgi:hypothetical protein